jgi:hypothetical protein
MLIGGVIQKEILENMDIQGSELEEFGVLTKQLLISRVFFFSAFNDVGLSQVIDC